MMQYSITLLPDEDEFDDNDGWSQYMVTRDGVPLGSSEDEDPLLDTMPYHEDGTVRSYRNDADFGIELGSKDDHLVNVDSRGTPYCSCSFTTSSGGILCTGMLRVLLHRQVAAYPMGLLQQKWLRCDDVQRRQVVAKLRMVPIAFAAPLPQDSIHGRFSALMSTFRVLAEVTSQSKTATDDLQKQMADLILHHSDANAARVAAPTPRRVIGPSAQVAEAAGLSDLPEGGLPQETPDHSRAEDGAPSVSPNDVKSLRDALGVAHASMPFFDAGELVCGEKVAVKYLSQKQGGWYAGSVVGPDADGERVTWKGKARVANYMVTFPADKSTVAVYLGEENYTNVATAPAASWLRYGCAPLSSDVPAAGIGNPELRSKGKGRAESKRKKPSHGPTSSSSHKKKAAQ